MSIIGNSIMVGGGGGKNISSIIITGLGSTDTITCTKDGKSYIATWDDNDQHWEIVGLPLGTFTVTATNAIATETKEVLIDVVSVFCLEISLDYYGDGSLNTTTNGYSNKVYAKYADGSTQQMAISNDTYKAGNFYINDSNSSKGQMKYDITHTPSIITNKKTGFDIRGTNTFGWSVYATNEDKTVVSELSARSHGCDNNATGWTWKHNDSWKTLKELVDQGVIKPMVLISSVVSESSKYYKTNVLNAYTGGNMGSQEYCRVLVAFIVNKGNVLQDMRITTAHPSLPIQSPDYMGYYQCPSREYKFFLKS